MISLPSFTNLVQGQQSTNSSSSTTRNVTVLSNLAGNASQVELRNNTVNYFDDARGYLVYPASSQENQSSNRSKLPAVIMIHENKGLNEHIKNMANLLAKHGYVMVGRP